MNLDMNRKLVDFTRKLQTRDGREVQIYCTDAGGAFPVHGAVLGDGGEWSQENWDLWGSYYGRTAQDRLDLVYAPAERIQITRWLNIDRQPGGMLDLGSLGWTREDADRFAMEHRIACLRLDLDFVVGEGLEPADAKPSA